MQALAGAVIAAAGLGSRIGLGMPKCMIEIEGKTLLSRLIESLKGKAPVVHVVVGYREDLVIDYCSKFHRDIVIVRNPEFRTAGVARSFSLGARHLQGKVVFMDGDLLVAEKSLSHFLRISMEHEILVGLTPSKSENAVFAQRDTSRDRLEVVRFSRSEHSDLEWANIVVGPSTIMNDAPGYVFERLAEHLPLPGALIDLAEIDTASDLIAAENFLKSH